MSEEKLALWLERISEPPKDDVANLEYFELLTECRIITEASA